MIRVGTIVTCVRGGSGPDGAWIGIYDPADTPARGPVVGQRYVVTGNVWDPGSDVDFVTLAECEPFDAFPADRFSADPEARA